MTDKKFRLNRKTRFYLNSLLRHDLKSSISVFFVALPLCLGISLACGAPLYSGLVAGIIGGLIVTLMSNSELSVSGPAAGLATICASAIISMGSIQVFCIAVTIAGIFQCFMGIFKLGGFTHFVPSAVIKAMLAAIGLLLISKQIPLLIGYDQPDFWRGQFFNIITLDHAFSHIENLYYTSKAGVIIVTLCSMLVLYLWPRYRPVSLQFLPASFITVITGIVLALAINTWLPVISILPNQFIAVPKGILAQIKFPDYTILFHQNDLNVLIWKNAVIIALVASLETLLSIAAIDKLDPFNRVTPQNRELVAQGAGNIMSGILGGLPITAVIVRSSANVEAGARSKLSSILHGLWLLIAILIAIPLLNRIPYCVLAVILTRTGYQLAKPSMIKEISAQGREQFLPFIVTVIAILITDLLIGVSIGIVFSIYFMFKHTYRAGFQLEQSKEGHNSKYIITLDQNVSFLNKRRLTDTLDRLPEYSIVYIDGTSSIYIDRDILEIIADFRSKAKRKKIQFNTEGIPEVRTIELH
jgi:MFS superfamily sulfate permease-like transporter